LQAGRRTTKKAKSLSNESWPLKRWRGNAVSKERGYKHTENISHSIYLTCSRKGRKKKENPSRMTAILACKRTRTDKETHTHTQCSSQTVKRSLVHSGSLLFSSFIQDYFPHTTERENSFWHQYHPLESGNSASFLMLITFQYSLQ